MGNWCFGVAPGFMANRVTRRTFLQWLGLAPVVVPVALEAMTAAPGVPPVASFLTDTNHWFLTRKTFVPGQVLRASDLNGEFTNIVKWVHEHRHELGPQPAETRLHG